MMRKTFVGLSVASVLAMAAAAPAAAQQSNPCAAKKPSATQSANPCAAKKPDAKK